MIEIPFYEEISLGAQSRRRSKMLIQDNAIKNNTCLRTGCITILNATLWNNYQTIAFINAVSFNT